MTEQELWPKCPLKLIKPNLNLFVPVMYACVNAGLCMYVRMDVCINVHLFSSYIYFCTFSKTK